MIAQSRRGTVLPTLALVCAAVLLGATAFLAGTVFAVRDGDENTMSVVDVGFAQDMSAHHDQAILMARTVTTLPAITPQVRGIADRIVVTQTSETATMRGWLQWFGHPLTADRPMRWMSSDSGHEHDPPRTDDDTAPPMPGMASTDDLGRLGTLTGTAAEVLFLQLMIRHHRGGMAMAQAAHNDPRARSVTKRLALTMLGDQGDENALMAMLLRERDAEPLPE